MSNKFNNPEVRVGATSSKHIFYGIQIKGWDKEKAPSEIGIFDNFLCFGTNWLGIEDIYFLLEIYNDYSPLWLITEMYYAQDLIDSPSEYEDDALDYNTPLCDWGADYELKVEEITLVEKKQIYKGAGADCMKMEGISKTLDEKGKFYFLKMNGLLLGYDFLYGNSAEEYYETFCPTEEIPHDEILIKLSPFPSEKDVAHKDFFSKISQGKYYKNRAAVADNFCPVAIFPSLKRIKEEVEKWPDIVSNEIEIMEIVVNCKSTK